MADPFTFDKRPGEATTGREALSGAGPAAPGDADVTLYQPRALRIGEIIGHYRIEAPLGQGGNGTAYAARNIDDEDERVAIKLIRPDRRDRARLARLLRAEAAALRRVKHDAIVQYRTFKRIPDSDEYYLVTEHIEGPTLSACLNKGALGPGAVARLAVRVADALEVAHAQGVIHRDLSPDNIILPQGDTARATLIDFGIAKQGTVDPLGVDFVGKLAFAAPEQFEGDPAQIGPWTDLYSLGLVLAAAARGRRLDMGRDMESAIAARRSEPKLDDVPDALRAPIAALLRPDPAARIRSAGAAAALFGADETLIAGRTDETVLAPVKSGPTQSLKTLAPARRPLRLGLAAALGVLALGAAGYGILALTGSLNAPSEDAVKPGGDGGSGGSPGIRVAGGTKPVPRSTTLNPDVAAEADKARRDAAMARVAELQAMLAERAALRVIGEADRMAAEAEAAAERGRSTAEEACTAPREGLACFADAGGRRAGERRCAGDDCIWSGYVSFTTEGDVRFDGRMDYGRYALGALTGEDKTIYLSAFDGELPTGPGHLAYPDGTVTAGVFAAGTIEGPGRLTYPGSDPTQRKDYTGMFANGLRHGYGVLRWKNGAYIAGSFVADQLNGYAVDKSAEMQTEASMVDWYAMLGIVRYRDGRRYEGAFGARVEGDLRVQSLSGLGVMYGADGTIEQQGRWKDDALTEPMP